MIKGTYCEGRYCSIKNSCALHCAEPGVYEYIDWSNYGGGHAWSDTEGNTHIETWVDCGDKGNFKKFVSLALKEDN